MRWIKRHKILSAVLLVLLVLVGTVVGYIWSKLSLIQYDTGTQTHPSVIQTVPTEQESIPPETIMPPETTIPEEQVDQIIDTSGLEHVESEIPLPDGKIERRDSVVNILLLGTDERTRGFSTNARSDAMILVSIDKENKTVKLVSLERGMGVPVLEGEYEGQYDWLTHIFRYGGANLVTKTVEHCFRVEIDHYVRINFTTVTSVVDGIGGINIYLSEAEAGALNRSNEASERLHQVNLKEGSNYLDGESALSLARLRSIDSDWYRVERQRRVITACVERLKGSSLADLDNMLNMVLPLIQTDMTMLEIAEMMLYAPNFLMSTFDQMTIPKQGTFGAMTGMGGRSLYAVDFSENSKILLEFLYGTEE